MDKQIALLQTVDRWTEEATELRKLNADLGRSVHELKGKTIAGLVNFYRRFTSPNSPTPGDILTNEMGRMQSSLTQLESGGISHPHTQVGFDYYGNQQGSSAQLDNILSKLSKTEADNAKLTQ
jgi:hypothetical protein